LEYLKIEAYKRENEGAYTLLLSFLHLENSINEMGMMLKFLLPLRDNKMTLQINL